MVVICSQSKRFWLDTEWEQLMQWLMTGPPMSCSGSQAPTSPWWLLELQTNPGETLWQDWSILKELQCIPVLGECADWSEIIISLQGKLLNLRNCIYFFLKEDKLFCHERIWNIHFLFFFLSQKKSPLSVRLYVTSSFFSSFTWYFWLSVCLMKWEYAATCFGLTGTAQQSLCEASLMAAMPFLLSTQLWEGRMGLLWTTGKMLVMLHCQKTILKFFSKEILLSTLLFLIHLVVPCDLT